MFSKFTGRFKKTDTETAPWTQASKSFYKQKKKKERRKKASN